MEKSETQKSSQIAGLGEHVTSEWESATSSIGALTGSLLLQPSVPAELARYGLLLLGMAGTIAEVDEI